MAWPCFDRPCKPRTETARTREEKIFFFVFFFCATQERGTEHEGGTATSAAERPSSPAMGCGGVASGCVSLHTFTCRVRVAVDDIH